MLVIKSLIRVYLEIPPETRKVQYHFIIVPEGHWDVRLVFPYHRHESWVGDAQTP